MSITTPGSHFTCESSFTMTLGGAVDAVVNGGINNYRTFITEEYKVDNPEIYEDMEKQPEKLRAVDDLKKALKEQKDILREGITLHALIIDPQLRPLHDHMERSYQRFCSEIDALLSPPIEVQSSSNV